RLDEEWRTRVLPHSRANPRHRICAATRRSRSHPHDLSRSNKRLRRQADKTMNTRTLAVPIGLLCVWLAIPAKATAHRLDEYLQATRLSVQRDHVELEIDLTAGMNVATQVFGLIDSNHDGHISTAEGEAYAQSVLRSVVLSADGRAVPMNLLDSQFPEFQEMAAGIGTARLRVSAAFPFAGSGRHQIYFRNTHQSEMGAYLVNALIPADKQIQITGQRRDYLQHELTIDYEVISGSRWSSLGWLVVMLGMAAMLALTRLELQILRSVASAKTNLQ